MYLQKVICIITFLLKLVFCCCLEGLSMIKIAGSGSDSGSISQRHGSADPDPDPHQNVMDPQHWFVRISSNIFEYLRTVCMNFYTQFVRITTHSLC
jgi:hypothetical protein